MVEQATNGTDTECGRARRRALVAGLIAGLAGLAVSAVLAGMATGQGYGVFMLAAPAAGVVAGSALWWWLVARSGRFGLWRGALAGLLIVVAGHGLTWLFVMLGSWTCWALTGDCLSSLGEPPIDPLNALWAAPAMGLLSLLVTGWVTLPAGILLGYVLARLQRPA